MTDPASAPAGDQPEQQADAPATPPPPGSGTYGEMLHLADAIKMIEEKRQVAFGSDDTQRQNLLKQMRRGEFPPPSKPHQKLPRRDGGDVDWSECWWAREDVETWLEGQTSSEKWESRWNGFSGIKTWREWPSLASYAARRVVKGEGEWEHWADRYRPRAFTGQFLRFLAWACAVGALCFFVLPSQGNPVVQTDPKTGETIYHDNVFISTDGKLITQDVQASVASGNDVYRYVRSEDGAAAGANARPTPRMKDGKPERAPMYKYKSKKQGDLTVYVNAKGEIIKNAAGVPITEGPALLENGVPESHFFSFMAAPLPSLFPGATVPLMIFIILVGAPGLFMLYKFCYGWLSLSYVLTDSRLIVREGLLARHEHQVRVIQIQDMSVHQGLLQVMLGVGDIVVHSDDVDTPELTIQGIRDPRAVKDRMFSVSEAAKQEKRYYIESTGGGAKDARPAR